MKSKVIILDKERKTLALRLIESLPFEPVHILEVKEYKKNRSASQSSLYWLWMTAISNYTGETKDEVHERHKKKFLTRIFERDDPDGYGAMIDAVRKVHTAGMVAQARKLAAEIVKLTSTTVCTVDQFTEYLKDVSDEAYTCGIPLPFPEDIYSEAMGKLRP